MIQPIVNHASYAVPLSVKSVRSRLLIPYPPGTPTTTLPPAVAVIELPARVTAPFLASARPAMVAPVFTVIEVKARIVPLKVAVVPIVALEPTTQITLAADALFISEIRSEEH